MTTYPIVTTKGNVMYTYDFECPFCGAKQTYSISSGQLHCAECLVEAQPKLVKRELIDPALPDDQEGDPDVPF